MLVLSAGDPLVNERILEQLRRLDRTPQQIGLWETPTNDPWPALVEDIDPDPRYL